MVILMLVMTAGQVEAAPRNKAETTPATVGTAETFSQAPPEAKADPNPAKDLSASYKAAMRDVSDFKKAKRQNRTGDVTRLASAVKAFGEIMLERPEVKVDYETAAVLLLEADPSLASRTVVGLWKSTDGRPEFEPMVLRLHGVLTDDLKKLGLDPVKRPVDLAPKPLADCKTRIDKIAAIAQLTDDLKRLDEQRAWRLLGADYTMICMGQGGDLETAYNAYAAYTETERAKAAALRVAEDALVRFKVPASIAMVEMSTGKAVAWDAKYIPRAIAWFQKAGRDEAEIRARIAPLGIEAEEAEQYAVAREVYAALGDDVNRRRMELILDAVDGD